MINIYEFSRLVTLALIVIGILWISSRIIVQSVGLSDDKQSHVSLDELKKATKEAKDTALSVIDVSKKIATAMHAIELNMASLKSRIEALEKRK